MMRVPASTLNGGPTDDDQANPLGACVSGINPARISSFDVFPIRSWTTVGFAMMAIAASGVTG